MRCQSPLWLAVLLLICSQILHAQKPRMLHPEHKRANVWRLGGTTPQRIGLDFNPERTTLLPVNPDLVPPGQPLFFSAPNHTLKYSTGATICDTTGRLLFYTDGDIVADGLHRVVPGSNGLWIGGTSIAQDVGFGGLIVPQPGSHRYFLFGTEIRAGRHFAAACAGCLSYSLIEAPRPDAVSLLSKNVSLLRPVTEHLSAVHHANGRDIWVAAREFDSNRFALWLITENGIQPQPVFSSVDYTLNLLWPHASEGIRPKRPPGVMKFSPDGRFLALTLAWPAKFQVYRFDNVSGRVGPAVLDTLLWPPDNALYNHGVEFSPSGDYVYMSYSSTLFGTAYGLLRADLRASRPRLSPLLEGRMDAQGIYSAFFGTSGLQLGTDGKIYGHVFFDRSAIGYPVVTSVLEDPDSVRIRYQTQVPELYSDNYGGGGGGGGGYSGPVLSAEAPMLMPMFVQSYFRPAPVDPRPGPGPGPPLPPLLVLPSAFSPNGDGINDRFVPVEARRVVTARVQVTDRWGQLIWEGSPLTAPWDAAGAEAGIYFWLCQWYDDQNTLHTQKGTVAVMK